MTLSTDTILRLGRFAQWMNDYVPRLALFAFWPESITGAIALAHDLPIESRQALDVLRFRIGALTKIMGDASVAARALSSALELLERDARLAAVNDSIATLTPVGREAFEYGYGYTTGLRFVHERHERDIDCPFCLELLSP